MNRLDLKRLNKLATGEIFAETEEERIFVLIFDKARQGYLLGPAILESVYDLGEVAEEDHDGFSVGELEHIIMGYSMGQEALEEIEENIQDTYGNNKVH